MTETKPVLTPEELADYLRVPVEDVIRSAEQGIIPGQKIGEHWRFLSAAVRRWLGGPYADVTAGLDDLEPTVAALRLGS